MGMATFFILILRQCSRYLYAIHQIVHIQMIAVLPGCKLMKAVFFPEFYSLGIQFFLYKTASHQTTLLAFGLLMRTEKTRNCYSVPKADRASALGGITEKKTLSKLDVKTAEIVPLMDITDYGLYSACGDCFIVYQANEREQYFYCLYPGYDTAAILASTPFYSNETSKTGAFVSVDTLFEYDYQTASLKTRNLLTGEEKCFDCSPYAEQPDDEHRPDCRGPYGKYLLYETSYVSKEGYFLPHYRVLNLENGEFSEEMNLKDSQGNSLTSLTVVKDQFCVVYDYTSVNIAVADDNTMENVLIPKYALLSQDDYFHCFNLRQIDFSISNGNVC